MTTSLITAAKAAAAKIAQSAEDREFAYSACQGEYGVGVEVMTLDEYGDEVWRREGYYDEGEGVDAVRLYDCDGERGEACRTVEEINAEVSRWCAVMGAADAN